MRDTTFTVLLEASGHRESIPVTNFTDIQSAIASFTARHGLHPTAVIYRDGKVFGSVTDGGMRGKIEKGKNLGEIG